MNNVKRVSKLVSTEENITPVSNKIILLILNNGKRGSNLYLGDPVLNDGYVFAQTLKSKKGYEVFTANNLSSSTVLSMIKKLVSIQDAEIIIYYSGHGTTITDSNEDEDDGQDEAFVFGYGDYLVDDDFAKCVNENMVCSKLTCIADCCHAGTIWDTNSIKTDLQEKMQCISSCLDKQTSKQLHKNGVFTMNFWQNIDLETGDVNVYEFNRRLRLFDQQLVLFPSDIATIVF